MASAFKQNLRTERWKPFRHNVTPDALWQIISDADVAVLFWKATPGIKEPINAANVHLILRSDN
jgi:hypothetical protein